MFKGIRECRSLKMCERDIWREIIFMVKCVLFWITYLYVFIFIVSVHCKWWMCTLLVRFLKEVLSYVHQSCFYMLKIQENINMFNIYIFFFKFSVLMYFKCHLKCNLFLWCWSWIFSSHYSSVTWSFRNNSNMLICCDFLIYNIENKLCCFLILLKPWHI